MNARIGPANSMTQGEMERIVTKCLDKLFRKDLPLLQNDVSERAITHKLAEYLQDRFPELNVDCEYNRNFELGPGASKILNVLRDEWQTRIRAGSEMEEDDLLAISTYPDIIVHRRLTNTENLLVIEVKKRNSKVGHNHDHKKLAVFTDTSDQNMYQ